MSDFQKIAIECIVVFVGVFLIFYYFSLPKISIKPISNTVDASFANVRSQVGKRSTHSNSQQHEQFEVLDLYDVDFSAFEGDNNPRRTRLRQRVGRALANFSLDYCSFEAKKKLLSQIAVYSKAISAFLSRTASYSRNPEKAFDQAWKTPLDRALLRHIALLHQKGFIRKIDYRSMPLKARYVLEAGATYAFSMKGDVEESGCPN